MLSAPEVNEVMDHQSCLVQNSSNEPPYQNKFHIFATMNNEISSVGKSLLTYSLASAGSIFETIIYMIIVPILIFFLLYDKNKIYGWFKKFFPEKLDL